MTDAVVALPAPASAATTAPATTPPAATTGTPPATAPAASTTTTQTTTPATAPAAGGDAKPAEGAKPAADAKPAETKGDAKPFDLKLPEGAKLDGATATEFAAAAQKAGLSAEQAQAALEFFNAKAGGFLDGLKQAQTEAFENQVKAWDAELRADTEIGGEKLQANLETGRRALERFADKEAIEFLRESGLNSHPKLARIFVRIGKAMGEDKIAAGGTGQAKDLRSIYTSMPNP